MRQFQVYRHPDPRFAKSRPYVVVLQHDIVSTHSIVVAPLARATAVKPAERLAPLMTIADEAFVLLTHELGAIDRRHLGAPVADLFPERDRFVAAIDFLFTGV